MHDPERVERVRAACSKGGKMRAIAGQRRKLDTAAALVTFGSERLQDIQDGTMPLDVGRGLFYALSVQAKLVELAQTAELERRLAALEERIGSGGRRWA